MDSEHGAVNLAAKWRPQSTRFPLVFLSLSFPLMALSHLANSSSSFPETQQSLFSERDVLSCASRQLVCLWSVSAVAFIMGCLVVGNFSITWGGLTFFLYLFQGQRGSLKAVLKWWLIECMKCPLKFLSYFFMFEIVP